MYMQVFVALVMYGAAIALFCFGHFFGQLAMEAKHRADGSAVARYSRCRCLCLVGAWVASGAIVVVCIYPFLLQ